MLHTQTVKKALPLFGLSVCLLPPSRWHHPQEVNQLGFHSTEAPTKLKGSSPKLPAYMPNPLDVWSYDIYAIHTLTRIYFIYFDSHNKVMKT